MSGSIDIGGHEIDADFTDECPICFGNGGWPDPESDQFLTCWTCNRTGKSNIGRRRDCIRLEQQRRRELFPETSGYVNVPPVLHREPYTPTLRRIDWCEVALIGFGAVVVFVAGYLLGGGRVGL